MSKTCILWLINKIDKICKATGENRKYLSIENCLEKRGHDVIFYIEESNK